ncbi:MAG: hypothetical protein ACI4UU_01525 [Clostridia bacterium]
MNKFIRFFNQNKKGIIKVIIIIAFAFILLQLVNSLLKPNKSNNNKLQQNIKDNDRPNQSVITGQELSEKVTEENIDIIKQFVKYCNNKEIEQAYSLLSDDCKQEFNNSIDTFKSRYYNNIFKTNKTYNLELWISNKGYYTYKILYYEDNLLATGGAGINNNIEDYITIINQNGENKININGFIGKEIINKSKSIKDVEILINSKNVYRDYESYNITIRNYTENTITISDGETAEDICLLDKNNVKYLSFIEELPEYDLSLKAKRQTTLNINFNKIYDTYRIIKKIKFGNINLGDDLNQAIDIIIEL